VIARSRLRTRAEALGAVLVIATGCAPAVTLDAPRAGLPASFRGSAVPGGKVDIRENEWPSLDWWKVFEDPVLDALIRESVVSNRSLEIAARQVEVARAVALGARAPLFPQVTAIPGVSWQRVSDNAPFQTTSRGQTLDSYAIPITLSYELDFWGKNKLAFQSAQSLALATEADWRTLQIEIVAAVASTYFGIVTTLAEIRVAEQTLDSYRSYLDLLERRLAAGAASELELQRIRAQISLTEAIIPGLRRRGQELQHRLAVLAGRNPGDAVTVRPLEVTRLPAELPGGVPSGLLHRRPDVQAQQERVQAAAALVGVARALYFPSFTIDLAAGASSIAAKTLFFPESFAVDLLAQAAVPIFRGGALDANLDANVAAYKQAVAAYEQSILVALQETQDAVSQIQELTTQRDELRQAVAEEERSYRLVNRAYEGGVSSYLEVLDVERSLLTDRAALTVVEGARLVAMVSLFKSLGGGWQ
jgi:NodT family efflux transporter outer membrane factor (OMF) lipoprotein